MSNDEGQCWREDPQSSSVSSPSSGGLDDKASSSSPAAATGPPLYQLSQLINDLPVERGLSKHYGGRSQSYTCLTKVKSLEDLEKKENSYYRYMKRRRTNACKRYELEEGFGHNQWFGPKPGIAKKVSSKNKVCPIAFELEKYDLKLHLSKHHGRASDVKYY